MDRQLRAHWLAVTIEPYLPIARVDVILAGHLPALRKRLIQRTEAELQGNRWALVQIR
jgi:hypothetical protein